MLFLILAVVVGLFMAVPFAVTGNLKAAGGALAVGTLVFWFLFYWNVPSLAGPWFGGLGTACIGMGAICGIVAFLQESSYVRSTASGFAGLFAVVLLVIGGGRGCANSEALNAQAYAAKLGTVQERVWTQDVQPKDPKHIRLVSYETASFLADKQLGSVQGAIGSQYSVDKDRMTLQIIGGELWYVAPLDFNGFSVWQTKGTTPGYVMVHGEDPSHPVKVVTGKSFRYMPGAWMSDNLERHVWTHGYSDKLVTDFTFEISDEGAPLWTATVSEPTIGWWAPQVLGVVLVDPENGAITFHKLGETPHWLDRVVPHGIAWDYLKWYGGLSGGWINSFYGKNNLTEPEAQSLVYGSDGEPYWVTSITSTSSADQSLTGLVYTNARTGEHIRYAAKGSTEAGILQAVNNKVQYKRYHGASPVLYNVYGTMAYIMPLVGESHVFQGVAIANVENPSQVAVGDDAHSAFREYQRQLAAAGQQVVAESAHEQQKVTGTVDRFACELKGTETQCYVHVRGVPHLFTGSSELSAKLPLTEKGDEVVIAYVASGEDVEPMLQFDNASLVLQRTTAQAQVQDREQQQREGQRQDVQQRTVVGELKNMSPQELAELLKLREQQKQKSQ